MKYYYITFRSVTYAQRGEQVLSEGGVRCTLQRTPKWMEERGCGYCLRLWTGDVNQAVVLLRKSRVSFRKIYAQREDGILEERTV